MNKVTNIPLSLIEMNEGQIEGIPRNPRQWSIRDLEKLMRSIEETPELLSVRPPILKKCSTGYVAIGGNMRIDALKHLGRASVDCFVLPDDMPDRKVKEIAIKDNTQLGSWNYDDLANYWSDYDLADYGLPIFEEPAVSDGGGKTSAPDDSMTIEIPLSFDEFSFVLSKLREIDAVPEKAVLKLCGND